VDRSRVAEFALSLVLPEDRAAAVVGDFLEEAGKRGGFWFWSSVVRTVASRVVNDFRERPFAMMGVGIVGFLRNVAFMIPPLAGLFILSHFRGHYLGEPVMVNVAPSGTPPRMELMWQIDSAVNILWAAWLFGCGRWAARKMAGIELAAAVATGAMGWIAFFAWAIYLRLSGGGAVAHPGVVAWHDLPLIMGAVWARYVTLKSEGRKPLAQG